MIEVNNLCKTYNGTLKAVDDLSFSVNDGEIVGFIGPNGAGKTTTIKMITGIMRPDAGSVRINDFNIVERPVQAKEIMGYISDNPDIFLKLTGLEYINLVADIYKIDKKERVKRIHYYTEQFGLTSVLGERMSGYSHGMRQKIMIVSALVHNPEVWILDEPMVGLDPQAAYNLKQMMRKHADMGNSVLFSTHILEVAEKLCDRIVVISHGRMQYVGTLDVLKQQYDDMDLEQIILKMMGEHENE